MKIKTKCTHSNFESQLCDGAAQNVALKKLSQHAILCRVPAVWWCHPQLNSHRNQNKRYINVPSCVESQLCDSVTPSSAFIKIKKGAINTPSYTVSQLCNGDILSSTFIKVQTKSMINTTFFIKTQLYDGVTFSSTFIKIQTKGTINTPSYVESQLCDGNTLNAP